MLMLDDDTPKENNKISSLRMKALLNRGLLYFQIGDMKNAVHDFLLTLEGNSHNPKIHHTLGLCYHKLGDLQSAIKAFTNAFKIGFQCR